MTPYLLITAGFLIFSSFTLADAPLPSHPSEAFNSAENIIDFSVQRMSGGRVFIKWRTEGEPPQVSFEVMRKHSKTAYVSIGMVRPKEVNNNNATAEYTFVDNSNHYYDSTYYCLRKKNKEGVLFYSIPKAVEGMEKNR
jgi:hypothetical protein